MMRCWEYKSINDECTTSLSWVTSAGGADHVKKLKCIAQENSKRMTDEKLQRR